MSKNVVQGEVVCSVRGDVLCALFMCLVSAGREDFECVVDNSAFNALFQIAA